MPAHNAHSLDRLDVGILELFREEPRIGVLEVSRRLGVARGTVQARIDKMVERGVVTGFGPDVDLAAVGYGVMAFTTIEVVQGRVGDVVEPLRRIPEVLEVHSIAGRGDMLIRLAARSNQHLMDLLERILSIEDVARTSTAIALASQIDYRVQPLLGEAGSERDMAEKGGG
jgi:DNA-binding Lrp family transcriptional regulator